MEEKRDMQNEIAKKYTREELEKKVALCYFKRRVSSNELDHMAASMEKEDFAELWEMCGQAFEMGERED